MLCDLIKKGNLTEKILITCKYMNSGAGLFWRHRHDFNTFSRRSLYHIIHKILIARPIRWNRRNRLKVSLFNIFIKLWWFVYATNLKPLDKLETELLKLVLMWRVAKICNPVRDRYHLNEMFTSEWQLKTHG